MTSLAAKAWLALIVLAVVMGVLLFILAGFKVAVLVVVLTALFGLVVSIIADL